MITPEQLLSQMAQQHGLLPRPSQQQMVQAIAAVWQQAEGGRQVIEAPTGVGKTLAYLVATLPIALEQQKRVILATATVNLQNQLMRKELPRLLAALPVPLRAAVAKGRQRYLCPIRLEDEVTRHNQALIFPDASASSPAWGSALQRLYAAWSDEADPWQGDLDRWSGALPAGLVGRITTAREGCAGQSCPAYSLCPYYRARAEVDAAQIVVTNHDTLLLQSSMPEGVLLPPLGEVLMVVDEAHHLPVKAVHTQKQALQLASLLAFIEEAQPIWEELARILRPHQQAILQQRDLVQSLWQSLRESLGALKPILTPFAPELALLQAHATPYLHSFQRSEPVAQALKAPLQVLRERVHALLMRFSHRLEQIKERLQQTLKNPQPFIYAMSRVGRVVQVLTEMEAFCQLFEQGSPERAPDAWWMEFTLNAKGELWITLAGSPTEAIRFLEQQLWAKLSKVVLTSATLRALSRFDYFLNRAGLSGAYPAQTLTLPSPFCHSKQATLVIPWMTHLPGGSEQSEGEYLLELTHYLNRTLPQRSVATLILWTSKAAMAACYAGLMPQLRQQILMQGGEWTMAQLLQLHAERVGRGEPSILMGLHSLAEGIDLPGALCEEVIITRLPFPDHRHPIEATYSRWIQERRGSYAYFFSHALPQASIRLVQMCGRLLRAESDRGRIILTDRRVVERAYGADLLRALPPYRLQVVNYPCADSSVSADGQAFSQSLDR